MRKPGSGSIPCHWELQVVPHLGHFREHLKSIMGEVGPVTRFSPVCVGVEREERKLRGGKGTGRSPGWVMGRGFHTRMGRDSAHAHGRVPTGS